MSSRSHAGSPVAWIPPTVLNPQDNNSFLLGSVVHHVWKAPHQCCPHFAVNQFLNFRILLNPLQKYTHVDQKFLA